MGDGRRALLGRLAGIVGPAHVVRDPARLAPYMVDWTGRFRGSAVAAVCPGSAAEVAALVALARAEGVAIVAQGGNTGLVGGSVPAEGDVVVSLRRLDAVTVDAAAGQLTAGAGATLAAVQRAAAAAGWAYGVDFASREQATVGGMVATNAGGLHVLRHGDTRAQLVGVQAVLGDGSVVSRLSGLVKDNAGYHLPSLLCGSEGTLGVVTAARLRLVPRADARAVALVAFDGVGPAVAAAGALRRDVPSVGAVELVLPEGLALVCRVAGLADPFPAPHAAYLVVEVADRTDRSADLGAALGGLAGVTGALVATEAEERARLWRYRLEHTAAVATVGVAHKLDVTLPADQLAAFVEEVPAVVAALAPGAAVWRWGHAADGNLHVNVTGLSRSDDRVDDAVFRLVAQRGGSISAEHGIGTAKRRWLALARTPAELAASAAVRRALDPDGILNPRVLTPETPGA